MHSLALLTLSVLSPAAVAADIRVPADYATIQDAITAASDFDRILVAPGTYIEDVDFEGKRLFVLGEAGPAYTTIQGTGLAPVVTFDDGEGRETLLQGFTITNGMSGNGGGIWITNASSPTIVRCIVTGNEGLNGGQLVVGGGGMRIEGNSAPNIVATTFSNNVAADNGQGILVTDSTLTLLDCSFLDHTGGADGAAIYTDATHLVVNRCTFVDNLVGLGVSRSGGAIVLGGGSTGVVSHSFFANNSVGSGSGGHGGAIRVVHDSHLVVTRSSFRHNTANVGGAIAVHTGRALVSSSRFCGNTPNDGNFTDMGGNLVVPTCQLVKKVVSY